MTVVTERCFHLRTPRIWLGHIRPDFCAKFCEAVLSDGRSARAYRPGSPGRTKPAEPSAPEKAALRRPRISGGTCGFVPGRLAHPGLSLHDDEMTFFLAALHEEVSATNERLTGNGLVLRLHPIDGDLILAELASRITL